MLLVLGFPVVSAIAWEAVIAGQCRGKSSPVCISRTSRAEIGGEIAHARP
jgi:hypothetical protein